jgi:hypothetical protein
MPIAPADCRTVERQASADASPAPTPALHAVIAPIALRQR